MNAAPASTFTVFCQQTAGGGTIHIAAVQAADLKSAILAGKQQCISDWSPDSSETQNLWNHETIHCLGVAEGDVRILHWEDVIE